MGVPLAVGSGFFIFLWDQHLGRKETLPALAWYPEPTDEDGALHIYVRRQVLYSRVLVEAGRQLREEGATMAHLLGFWDLVGLPVGMWPLSGHVLCTTGLALMALALTGRFLRPLADVDAWYGPRPIPWSCWPPNQCRRRIGQATLGPRLCAAMTRTRHNPLLKSSTC